MAFQPLKIKSPKATKLKFILPNDTAVAAGDVLVEFYDFEEQKLISTVQRSISENQSKLAEVTGPRVAERLQMLNTIDQQRKNTLEPTRQNYQELQFRVERGQARPWLAIRAQHLLSLRTYQSIEASVQLEVYRRNISDSKDILQVVDGLLHKELEFLNRLQTRLSVRAPRAGKFVSSMAVGDPVPLGCLVGELR